MTNALFSFKTRQTLSELLKLAWPVVLARLGIMTMGLTDAIVVGHYASRELAFHSLAWAPSSVVLTTAVGLMMGVQVMTARLLGEGRKDEVGAVLRRGTVYALQIGIVSMIALMALGPFGLMHMGLEDGLGEGASPVLMIFALSMPAYLISVAAQFFLEGLHRPKAGMVAMWVANAVNLGLNLLLVPDILGLGMHGAQASAWATFGARMALAVFLVIFILRLPEAKAWGLFNKPKRDKVVEREQMKVGFGAGSSNFIEVGAFAAMTLFAGQLGAAETASWAVVINVSAIVFMVPMGLSSATAVLVGRSYGAGDKAGVMRGGLAGIGVVTVLAFIIAIGLWLTAPLVVSAYTTDPAILAIAAPALVLATLFFVADAQQVVAAQANRAAGDVVWPTLMHLLSYGVIMIPLGWWLAHRIGVDGLVWSVIVASLISGALLTGRFVRIARRLPA
ncbi:MULTISPECIES: MATE family efflux transporter [unclassified Brevundimonas]|uniref:MATE family efflux transporter n=1 Tax=unclassified Brevundimonas TaxID=2622653 RepID=UPI000CFD5ABA|nr:MULTISPECIES: MATE family efflux transporter [unclassified Brevundimonas]PRA23052.1 MATE family efflux transporter [Brevundimonas sp. MYb27]PQZ81642.1 MATE family efflux transporter [Brevundimonas sp. MYb31]PRB10456.1 MATE family efflux transporter [Brevundimonas sp. MYb52]PRB32864.1 MATE family efflux transporter [Brevundimonas sp. MYb46]PRB47307.1 MATE family efflux transporter [Brevundimonas sp. MYb33]